MVRTNNFFDTITEIAGMKTGGECALRTITLLDSVNPGDVVENGENRNKALLQSLGLIESDGIITQEALDFWRSHHRVEDEKLFVLNGGSSVHSIIPLEATPHEAVCFTEVYDDEQMLVCYTTVPVRI